MVSYRYDATGKRLGYTKSSRDIDKEAKQLASGAIILIVLAVFLLPFAPILALCYYVFVYLHDFSNMHSLFSGLVSLGLALAGVYILWKSRLLRYLYFGSETVILCMFAFDIVRRAADVVWASFAAIVLLIASVALTHFAANFGFEDQRRGVRHVDDPKKIASAELGTSLTAESSDAAPAETGEKTPETERGKVRPKYRGPGGEEWTGRGRTPRWLVALEEAGRDRNEFLIR